MHHRRIPMADFIRRRRMRVEQQQRRLSLCCLSLEFYAALLVVSLVGLLMEFRLRAADSDSDRKAKYSFLFVDRRELTDPDRYLSVGTVVDGSIITNTLVRVSRLGNYRVIARPNKYDLWIHAPTAGALLCIDQATPLVSEMIHNAAVVVGV